MRYALIASTIALIFFHACRMPADKSSNKFINPILAGFYPDPSICKAGDDYYLVNSTFAYFPGIPVFHSKDLVNWKQEGHVIHRPEQVQMEGLGVSQGMFAPAISYNNGLFYVVCTFVGGDGNFVVTAKNPSGPWSDPVWIPEINGIDPSLFFDDNGKSYIVYNSVAPDNQPLYEGHRTIRMYEFDPEGLKVTGNEVLLVNGGVDITEKPVWIEGPHVYKKEGWYYLMAAEGGTSENHSEVIFRSRSIEGPYTPYENNPILTQRHLDPARPDPVTSTGHADLVEAGDGSWWAVFLGCRPYEEDHYNTGRETFMAPVEWKDGWPIINKDAEEVQFFYDGPSIAETSGRIPYNGNFRIWDDFDRDSLQLFWVFLRTPRETWYDLKEKKGRLTILLRPETCSGKGNPSFIGRRQQHLQGYANVSMAFNPVSENEKAGLLVFQNETHFYFLCKSLQDGAETVQLYKSSAGAENDMELLASEQLPYGDSTGTLSLKVDFRNDAYSFYYSIRPGEWKLVMKGVDATFLSTKTAGGFVGCMIGMYATSLGKPAANKASFNWFEYNGDDNIYKTGFIVAHQE